MANPQDLRALEKDPRLFLYTSLTAGSSHIITATSRLETILKANKIPFQAVDCATDEQARKLWQRRAGKKKLPGLVKEGFVIGDYDEVEEWNEYGELTENIGPLPTTAGAGIPAPKLPVKPTATAGSANLTPASKVDTSKMIALPGAAEIAARNKIIPKSSVEEPIKAENMTTAPDEKEKSIERAIRFAGEEDKTDKPSTEKHMAEKEDTTVSKEGEASLTDKADGADTLDAAVEKPEEEAEGENPSPLKNITNTKSPDSNKASNSVPDSAVGENIVPENIAALDESRETQTDTLSSSKSTTAVSIPAEKVVEKEAEAKKAVDPETVEPAAEEGAETQATTSAPSFDMSSKDGNDTDAPPNTSDLKMPSPDTTTTGTTGDDTAESQSHVKPVTSSSTTDVPNSKTESSTDKTAHVASTAADNTAQASSVEDHNGAEVKHASAAEIKAVEEKISIPESEQAEAIAEKHDGVDAAASKTTESKSEADAEVAEATTSSETQNQPAADPTAASKSVED